MGVEYTVHMELKMFEFWIELAPEPPCVPSLFVLATIVTLSGSVEKDTFLQLSPGQEMNGNLPVGTSVLVASL